MSRKEKRRRERRRQRQRRTFLAAERERVASGRGDHLLPADWLEKLEAEAAAKKAAAEEAKAVKAAAKVQRRAQLAYVHSATKTLYFEVYKT